MDDDVRALREEVSALAERIAAVEERQLAPPRPAPAEGDFWALVGLQARLADDPSTVDGAVTLVGSLTLPTGAPVAWQQTIGTTGLLEAEWAGRATVFAALGHPVRIELLRHILTGMQATSDLASLESLGTTGQLHHHLRQLLAAGWVRQGGRGSYEVPAARIVPLLVSVLGAER